jgi:phospholipid/cholesterol/gamma-HCH transport system substrate-binding protein
MVTPRILVNLVVFLLVSAALITYGAVTLLGNPLTRGARISTTLDEASGVLPGFSAAYDGVIVGVVSDTELVEDGVRITVELDPGIEVPSDVEARVVRASAVGEQRLEMNPIGEGDGPPLQDGDEIPPAAEAAPPEISEVLDTAATLFDEIPADDLNTVIHETALAVQGREEDLRLLTRDLDIFAEQFLEHEDSFRSLLETAPPVLDSVTSVGPELEEALADTATLSEVLAERRFDLVDLMQHGAQFAEVADEIVGGQQANLACIFEDAAALSEFTGDPETLADLDAIFGLNQYFFGPIEDIAVVGHAEDVGYGAPDRENQRWLRVLTMVPPGTPPAVAYHPARPTPPTLPGGGCSNVFGNGVGPGTQADAQPPAVGGLVIEEGTSSGQSSEVSTGSAAAANSSDDPSTYNPVAAMAAAQQ